MPSLAVPIPVAVRMSGTADFGAGLAAVGTAAGRGAILGLGLGVCVAVLGGALRRVRFAIAGDELDPQPAEDVIDDALGVRDFRVRRPAGRLEPRVRELVDKDPQRHAVLQAERRLVPIVSIRPPIVLPSLAIVMNSSPGEPSSNRPTVM